MAKMIKKLTLGALGVLALMLVMSDTARAQVSRTVVMVRGFLTANGDSVLNETADSMRVTLYDTSGNALSVGTDYTHNGALTADSSSGPLSMRLAKDFDGASLPNVVSAEGDAVAGAATLYGVSYVMVVSEDGALERGTATTPFVVGDGSGALNIICDSGCSGGSQYAHDLALTVGSTNLTMAGFLAKDFDGAALPSTVSAANDAVMAASSLSGVQYVMLVSEDGALQYGTSTTPMVVGDGSGALNVIIDSSATLTVNAHAVTNAGTFAVQVDGNALTALQLIDDSLFADDAAFTIGTSKVNMAGFTVDESSTDSADEGDAVAARTTADRMLYTVGAATTASAQAKSACYIVSAASTNSNNCKNAAGNVYGFRLVNISTTVYYLRLYNLSSAPTCSSATGFIESIPVPPAAAAGAAGGIVSVTDIPVNYGTGIGYCITGGAASTDNTSAATGIYGAIFYK